MSRTKGGTDSPKGRILVVDDEEALARAFSRWLTASGYQVDIAADGQAAAARATREAYDVIVSDIAMPGMDGIELLRTVRQQDLDVPVVLMTASPAVDTAVDAVALGALRYLVKPIQPSEVEEVVEHAVRLCRLARLKREALALLGQGAQPGDRAGLEESFESALESLRLVFQPIVWWAERRVFAYEALMRSDEAALPHPGAVLAAAERLERLPDLGRRIRSLAAKAATTRLPSDALLFINLHPSDFLDPMLYSDAELGQHATRVVLEVTERASLDHLDNLRTRVADLRGLGYRIAVDDLGAGYAGLSAFANLEPDVVKIDMSLVRDIESARTKQKLVHSLTQVCRELKMRVVAEGVETAAERDALLAAGCDLLQGYLLARPGDFPTPTW
jgi:EAL domain-containing protein (putative c-di-GMP-specific phosphodiesterase class I)